MSDQRAPSRSWESLETVRHSLGGAWSQADLGAAFDVTALSVIGELDPTGAHGTVREVLSLFGKSLEPELERIEACLAQPAMASQLKVEAHRLKGAAAQMGALRLAAACKLVEQTCAAGATENTTECAEALIAEIIRVQRRLSRLLA
ncbi:MAG: Hpt domain-containing protein [Pseudomonadota bacterium]|nr:Hpt domain-containing protein [Pseudomonadota bacterium]